MNAETDRLYMQCALELARRGLYTTHPNPRVGCVIVRDGEVVGEGFHARAGEPHAEIHALRMAGDKARGATAYVTLEPCCHHGRTGPCSNALIEAGVARVVMAMRDPNPKVAGGGEAMLRAAGVEVQSGVLEAEARALNAGFIQRMTQGRPYVRLKWGASLDGRTALANGQSQWITGEAARHDVQFWRAQSSAILSTAETVLRDNARLNVRLTADELGIEGAVRQPVRVILDRGLRLTPQCSLFQSLTPSPSPFQGEGSNSLNITASPPFAAKGRGCQSVTFHASEMSDEGSSSPNAAASSPLAPLGRGAGGEGRERETYSPIWIYTASQDAAKRAALQRMGVQVIDAPLMPPTSTSSTPLAPLGRGAGGEGKAPPNHPAEIALDLTWILRDLARREVNEVWVEAGARLGGALLAQELVDELILYLAPMLLGHSSRPLAELPGLTRLDQAARWTWNDVRIIGDDLRLQLRSRRTN